MSHENRDTIIEMSSRPPRDPSPRLPLHETPGVHLETPSNSPARGRSPDRRRMHHSSNSNLHASNSNLSTSNSNRHSNHSTSTNEMHDERTPLNRRHRRDTSAEHTMPLLEVNGEKPKPPLAGPEIDDLDEDHDHATSDYHPGIDDGFFANSDDDNNDDNDDEKPTIDDRVGLDDGHPNPDKTNSDKHDGDQPSDDVDSNYPHHNGGNYIAVTMPMMYSSHANLGDPNGLPPRSSPFPYAPGFQPGFVPVATPDVNVYQQKKNLAQGMMDLALFSANANQLRYVLEAPDHPYFYPSVVFIATSLILQVAVGIGLILNSRYNVKEHEDICKADRINNFTVIGIFIITIVNVFIASFAVVNAPSVRN